MTDLADFLRARWAEAAAPRVVDDWHEPFCLSASNDNGSCFYCGAKADPSNVREIPQPPNVLADLDAKLALLDDLLAERHDVVEDCWYTCAAATEEQDGGETCNEARQGGPCDCGRDSRVNRRLRILARPFTGHPDYREEWRPTP
jgi:hypothetical protein